jgi:phosphatidylethanolamine-binding protein (PEBP) family uncharacterized protein
MPDGIKSLLFVVEDPDAPSGIFRHWAVFDIPVGSRGLDASCSTNRPASVSMKHGTILANRAMAAPVRPRDPTTITSVSLRSAGRPLT